MIPNLLQSLQLKWNLSPGTREPRPGYPLARLVLEESGHYDSLEPGYHGSSGKLLCHRVVKRGKKNNDSL